MRRTRHLRTCFQTLIAPVAALGLGVLIGAAGNVGLAQMEPPSEHKGVGVETLGVLPEASIKKQIGFNGYVLQLREITHEPGGQIARHSHASRPGLVYTLSGSWTEGRPSGERDYPAGEKTAILEDADTDHWFYNREDEPVTVVVCDLVPPS